MFVKTVSTPLKEKVLVSNQNDENVEPMPEENSPVLNDENAEQEPDNIQNAVGNNPKQLSTIMETTESNTISTVCSTKSSVDTQVRIEILTNMYLKKKKKIHKMDFMLFVSVIESIFGQVLATPTLVFRFFSNCNRCTVVSLYYDLFLLRILSKINRYFVYSSAFFIDYIDFVDNI